MATIQVEDSELRAFARVLGKLFGVQLQDDAAALTELFHQLQQQVKTMSDSLNSKLDANDAKVDQLVSAVTSLEQRVAANDQKLTAAEAARDAAVTDLASTKTTLDGVRAELAAITQVDTASIESRLEGESTKVQGAIDRLNAIDVTPAAPAPEPAPTPAPEPAPAPALPSDVAPTPVDLNTSPPASVDPNAPQGGVEAGTADGTPING